VKFYSLWGVLSLWIQPPNAKGSFVDGFCYNLSGDDLSEVNAVLSPLAFQKFGSVSALCSMAVERSLFEFPHRLFPRERDRERFLGQLEVY
jgi:hypothetical protein